MTEEVLIRQMRVADIERVLEIVEGLKSTPHWPRMAYLTALDPYAQPRRLALVAGQGADGAPIGFAIASLVLPSAELEIIGVAAEHQRRGWGGKLLEHLLEELRQMGVKEMWLEVRVSNGAAIRMYRRAGLVEIGYRKGYYTDPAEDATVMQITIS